MRRVGNLPCAMVPRVFVFFQGTGSSFSRYACERFRVVASGGPLAGLVDRLMGAGDHCAMNTTIRIHGIGSLIRSHTSRKSHRRVLLLSPVSPCYYDFLIGFGIFDFLHYSSGFKVFYRLNTKSNPPSIYVCMCVQVWRLTTPEYSSLFFFPNRVKKIECR